MRLANMPPDRFECFGRANAGMGIDFQCVCNLISMSPHFCAVARESQNLVIGFGMTFIGAANNEANDFPVFCADNYPVDTSISAKLPGNCKDCSVMLNIPQFYLSEPSQYTLESYVRVGYNALCEDL
jgi:hypothetical protein